MKKTHLRLSSFILVLLLLFSCSTSEKLTTKGWKKYNNGEYWKAEKIFKKSLSKKGSHEQAYKGIASTKYKHSYYKDAEYYMGKAYNINSSSSNTYNYACYSNLNGNSSKAMSLLYELPTKGSFDYYRKLATNDEDFNSLHSNIKFHRYLQGYRRLKIQPYYGYSSESDGWFNENDLFVVVENQKKIILTTDIVQESNEAYWENDYVIFDYPLSSSVRIVLMDEDIVKHDKLLSMNGAITKTNDYNWSNNNSRLKVKISDSEYPTYTTGTDLPSEVSLGEIALCIGAGAALYYITDSDELDHTSSNSLSPCANYKEYKNMGRNVLKNKVNWFVNRVIQRYFTENPKNVCENYCYAKELDACVDELYYKELIDYELFDYSTIELQKVFTHFKENYSGHVDCNCK